MKSCLRFTALLVCITLGACTTESPATHANNYLNKQEFTPTTKHRYPAHNAAKIAIYDEQHSPQAAYRVIGKAKISKYNILGVKRKDATVQNMIKKLAASVGGDAVIDLNQTSDTVQANIIQYQKILI